MALTVCGIRGLRVVTVALGLAVIALSPALGSEWDERVDALVAPAAPAMVEIRHELHRHPELSNRELATSNLVAAHLESLGLEVRREIAHTGVVGVLAGGLPGPVVAVRVDMDALPVTEDTDLPYRSTVRTTFGGKEVGVAHACGHDIHTAVGLGVATVLAEARDELPGTVLFVFQPAEEGPPPGERGGANLMLAEGVFGEWKPEAIFGLHSWPELEVGVVALAPGPTFASVDRFYVRLIGRQSHGAYPHQGVDPVVMGAQVVLALQTISSRTLDPREPAVVTVGVFQGGERYNIIPGEVRLAGTVRTYREQTQDTIERRMNEILEGITAAAGGDFELTYERVTPATVNDEALHEMAWATLVRVLGAENVQSSEPTMGGEDFAFFAREIPGYYFRLGTRSPGGSSGGLHTPDFLADDAAVTVGMRAMAALVVESLTRGASR